MPTPNENESLDKTPECDKEERINNLGVVDYEFARCLERDLNKALAEVKRLSDACNAYGNDEILNSDWKQRAIKAESSNLALKETIAYVCQQLNRVDCGSAPVEELARRIVKENLVLSAACAEMKTFLEQESILFIMGQGGFREDYLAIMSNTCGQSLLDEFERKTKALKAISRLEYYEQRPLEFRLPAHQVATAALQS